MPHRRQPPGVDHAGGLGSEGDAQLDHVAAGDQLVEADLPGKRVLTRSPRPADDVHPERGRQFGDAAADAAEPHHADATPAQLGRRKPVTDRPVAVRGGLG